RRDNDIRNLGKYAAEIFDEVIIRHDHDGRGRTNEELTRLISEGVKTLDPKKKITVISEENDALLYAINKVSKNGFIVVCSDKVRQCIEFVKQQQSKYQQQIAETAVNK